MQRWQKDIFDLINDQHEEQKSSQRRATGYDDLKIELDELTH